MDVSIYFSDLSRSSPRRYYVSLTPMTNNTIDVAALNSLGAGFELSSSCTTGKLILDLKWKLAYRHVGTLSIVTGLTVAKRWTFISCVRVRTYLHVAASRYYLPDLLVLHMIVSLGIRLND